MPRVIKHEVRLDLEGVEHLALEVGAGMARKLDGEGVGDRGVFQCRRRCEASVFGEIEGVGVDVRAAVREAEGPGRQSGYSQVVDGKGEVDQGFGWRDGHTVVWDALLHDGDETGGSALVGRDEEEVVDEAEQQAVVDAQEGQLRLLQIRIEIVAQHGRDDRALRDAGLLAIVFLADLDEVLLDVRAHEPEEVARAVRFAEDAVNVHGVLLARRDLPAQLL